MATSTTSRFNIPLPARLSRNPSTERRWRIALSYAPDWALTIFLWGIFYLLDKVQGYRRLFSVTDTSLAHPYAVHERVPVWALVLIAGIAPAVIILLVAGAVRRSFWDCHSGILGLILSLGLTVTFTDIIKITAGRPRPDLFDRCQLPADLTSNPLHGLTSWTVCTRLDKLNDGFRSFPSGHSSFAWCGLWYLTLWLGAKMQIANSLGYTYKSWLLLIPISAAALVAVSRTMDYRHHSTDVIAGAIIGILAAWWSYRQYYPAVLSSLAERPYPPRIPLDPSLPLTQVRHASTRDRAGANGLSPELANGSGLNAALHEDVKVKRGTVNGYPPLAKQEPRDLPFR